MRRDALPVTATGKVQKVRLAETLGQGARRCACMMRILPTDWRRNVLTLTLSVFITSSASSSSRRSCPSTSASSGDGPGEDPLWSGLLAAVTPAMSGILSPVFGRLADRFGRKMMLIRSLVGFVVIVSAMGLVTSVEQLFLARVVMGFFAGFTPMVMALATTSAPQGQGAGGDRYGAVGPAPERRGRPRDRRICRFALRHPIRLLRDGGLCALALVGLILLFQEVSPDTGAQRQPASKMPLSEVFKYPHFATVMALLFAAQFVDRGLALLIPLQVAHLPGIEKIAAISGAIVSIGAIAATISANVAARLSREVPAARISVDRAAVGGPLCAAMALPGGWPMLLVLRLLTGLCLGAAITLTTRWG